MQDWQRLPSHRSVIWGKREGVFYTAVRRSGWCIGIDVFKLSDGSFVIYPVNSRGGRGPVSIIIPADQVDEVAAILKNLKDEVVR